LYPSNLIPVYRFIPLYFRVCIMHEFCCLCRNTNLLSSPRNVAQITSPVSSLLSCASLQCVCCILFIVQCICMLLHTFCNCTSFNVCVCVWLHVLCVCVCVWVFCIYACSNLFIVCIFVYVVYRTLNKLMLQLLLLLLQLHVFSFIIFYWALAALSIGFHMCVR